MKKYCGKNLDPNENARGGSTCMNAPAYGDHCYIHRTDDDGFRRVVCGHPNCANIAVKGREGWCDADHSTLGPPARLPSGKLVAPLPVIVP